MSKLLRVLSDLVGAPVDTTRFHDVDPALVDLLMPAMNLVERYLRAEVEGLEHLPEGPALLVGNHNGGVAFLEPFLLGKALWERDGTVDIHALAHDVLMDLPVLGNAFQRLGAVRAGPESAGRVLEAGRKVWVFPGGNYEAFRPWRERHRVDFGGHKGFARLAIRHQVPVVPVLCLGGHEAFFVLARGERLARWTGIQKRFRSRSFPIYLGLPWGLAVGPLPHIPLPVRTEVEVGVPMHLEGYPPEAADDPRAVQEVHDRVVHVLQAMMDRRLEARRQR